MIGQPRNNVILPVFVVIALQLALAGWATGAQPSAVKLRTIGFVDAGSVAATGHRAEAFVKGLGELGFGGNPAFAFTPPPERDRRPRGGIERSAGGVGHVEGVPDHGGQVGGHPGPARRVERSELARLPQRHPVVHPLQRCKGRVQRRCGRSRSAHLGGGAQWTASTYGLQITTADEFRGRIFATDFALVTLTMSVSFTIAGLVAESVGPGPVIAVLAGLSAVWATAYLLATRGIRARAATAGALGAS